jgi:NCS1 family nucleobase:cation symporter-1
MSEQYDQSHRLEVRSDLHDSPLYNDDLAPVTFEERTWGAMNIAALWVGMVVCIPTYMLASSMIQQGMSWTQAIFTIFLGNVIVLIPMVLNGVAGTRYGVSFPVLIRTSFGTVGTHVPSLMRALVACGWFGIQTAIGGAAIFQLVEAMRPGLLSELPQLLPAWVGLSTGQAFTFLVFWVINVYFIVAGTESIKWLETAAAPFLLLMGLALLGWAVKAGGGFDKILVSETKLAAMDDFLPVFWPNLTAMVGFWATLSLNIPDFTRYAKSQRAQLAGQALGLPLPMALFSFIGVAVTGATIVVFGEAIWDPVVLLGKFDSPIVVMVSLFVLAVATLTTNIAANVIAPANSFANLWPRRIGLRGGGVIAALIGIAILPWKLLADPSGYIFTWLIGYSALLGPIAGVMIADFFIVQRGRILIDELYTVNGVYQRISWRAMVALVVAILPNLPGFLDAIGASAGLPQAITSSAAHAWLSSLYPYAWFVGFAIAFVIYAVIGRRVAKP